MLLILLNKRLANSGISHDSGASCIIQSFLLPECFIEFNCNHSIATSMAASLRDICRRNPERGVQLILSVAVWIFSCFLYNIH